MLRKKKIVLKILFRYPLYLTFIVNFVSVLYFMMPISVGLFFHFSLNNFLQQFSESRSANIFPLCLSLCLFSLEFLNFFFIFKVCFLDKDFLVASLYPSITLSMVSLLPSELPWFLLYDDIFFSYWLSCFACEGP